MTLNLHGLHPMNEERRILRLKNGQSNIIWSNLNYFSPDELKRGHGTRQIQLSKDIKIARPDIIFLQEVGGAFEHSNKDCDQFYFSNSAKDLNNRLNGYNLYPACRGNIGWWTNPSTFNEFQIIREDSQSLVYQNGDNPYPDGLIIEGQAFLTGHRINVYEHFQKLIEINSKKEKFFFHGIKFGLKNEKRGRWWVAINIHGGHKIQHFEQAISTRIFITEYLSKQDMKGFGGIISAGDFNAFTPIKEVSSTPWSYAHRWQTREQFKKELLELNRSPRKPFATLTEEEAQWRADASIEKLFQWFSLKRHPFDGSLKEVSDKGVCLLEKRSPLNPTCHWKDKIDHIFVSENINIKSYSGIYRQNNWTDLKKTISDHPGVICTLEL